jgi:serine protease Do
VAFTPLSRARTGRRITAATSVALASALALSGCFGLGDTIEIDAEDFPVNLDRAQTATLQITAAGEFYEPNTSEPYSGGWFGSGFIVTPSGLALTNSHVASGATSFEVRPGGGTGPALSAEVVSTSECLDLAVLRLPADQTYPFMGWRQGDIAPALDVYSAGFPNGTTAFTLTGGIVNTANQSVEFPWASVDAAIEHDARIRGGNSGGPLIDEQGRIVGVNYAVNNLQDYNYAIAREQVLDVLDRMLAGENVLSLGINARAVPLDEETGEPYGVWVQSVQPGSPAEAAGIQAADVLVELDGVPLGQTGTLQEYCDILDARGTTAALDVIVARPLTGDVLVGQINGASLEIEGGTDPVDPGLEDFVVITDDTGVLSVEVPGAWADTLGYGVEFPEGAPWATVIASTDLSAFLEQGAPGVLVATSDQFATADPAEFLELSALDLQQSCTGAGVEDYADGYYTGLSEVWECSSGAIIYVIAANADDGSHFARLSMVMFDEFDTTTALERVLNTFIATY